MSLFVVSEFSTTHEVDRELPDLQGRITALAGQRIRRIDRYIQLCLLGALECTQAAELPSNCGVVLATGNGTISVGAEIMQSVFEYRHLPKPLHFVNALGNSACFYLSQTLNISGGSLVVSEGDLSFEAALLNAQVMLDSGACDTVLVGGVDEVLVPIADHALRMESNQEHSHLVEGSHWLLAMQAPAVQQEKTQQSKVQVSEPRYFDDLADCLAVVQPGRVNQLFINFQPSPEEKSALHSLTTSLVVPKQNHITHRTFSGHNVISAVQNLRKNKNENYCVVLSRNQHGDRYALTLINSQ